MKTKPRMRADANDPRCIDYRSGVLIGNAFDTHEQKTGETLPTMAKNVGIGPESMRAYARGHQVPSPQSRHKLEKYLGLSEGALIPKPYRGDEAEPSRIVTTQTVEDGFLIVTTRIPLDAIAA